MAWYNQSENQGAIPYREMIEKAVSGAINPNMSPDVQYTKPAAPTIGGQYREQMETAARDLTNYGHKAIGRKGTTAAQGAALGKAAAIYGELEGRTAGLDTERYKTETLAAGQQYGSALDYAAKMRGQQAEGYRGVMGMLPKLGELDVADQRTPAYNAYYNAMAGHYNRPEIKTIPTGNEQTAIIMGNDGRPEKLSSGIYPSSNAGDNSRANMIEKEAIKYQIAARTDPMATPESIAKADQYAEGLRQSAYQNNSGALQNATGGAQTGGGADQFQSRVNGLMSNPAIQQALKDGRIKESQIHGYVRDDMMQSRGAPGQPPGAPQAPGPVNSGSYTPAYRPDPSSYTNVGGPLFWLNKQQPEAGFNAGTQAAQGAIQLSRGVPGAYDIANEDRAPLPGTPFPVSFPRQEDNPEYYNQYR